MFRKIVSNLPFSPALVGQLGFYARRLKGEEITRKFGLLFTVFALIMQSFAVFSPPEQALASSGSDIIPGGVSSMADILSNYDMGAQGKNDFKDFIDYFGVTRGEIASMSKDKRTLCSSDQSIISFGRQRHFSAAEGTLTHHVPRANGGSSTFYSVPLYRYDVINHTINCYPAFVGNSKKIGWFAILEKCGNLEIKKSVQRVPRGSFVSATCRTIQGFAYDERQTDQSVKVYLFFGGPPGKGKQYGPITAKSTQPGSPATGSHGFSFSVPAEYQNSKNPTTVWGILQPLAGWNEPQVQFTNTVTVPGDCTPTQSQIAECTSIRANLVQRTKITLSAQARVENGAALLGYRYVVVDRVGKTVYDNYFASGATAHTSPAIDLTAGTYSARVIVKTSLGDRSGENCVMPVQVATVAQCSYNPSLPANDPNCSPCPHNPSLWSKSPDCAPPIAQAKEVKNLTQNVSNANNTTARAGDRLEYTIYTTNIGSIAITTPIEENLSDVLEYGSLWDNGNGKFDNTTKVISWGETALIPGQTAVHKVTILLYDVFPTTPRSANNPAAFDCVITNNYGNTTNVKLDCPAAKTVETAVKTLPSTGVGANAAFATVTIMIVTYFYMRSRMLRKEIRLIKNDLTKGGI